MKLFSVFILLFFLNISKAQDSTVVSISGQVLQSEGKPVANIAVKLVAPTYDRTAMTDQDGRFSFNNVFTGGFTVVVSDPGYFEYSQDVEYIAGERMNLGEVKIESSSNTRADDLNDIPTVDQGDDDPSGASNNTVASILNSSRDIFLFNAFMGLGQGGYRLRGYNGQDQLMFINGIPMENILQGNQLNFNDYVGLNDMLRGRNTFYGIKAIPFAFGEQTSNVDIDAEAINQRKGLRVTQNVTNRNFTSRTSVAYNTGLLKNNFAFSALLAFRGASEGYISGTQLETYSGYLGVSKKWSQKMITSLTAFIANNKRAVSTAATREYYQLAGSNFYNPNWGMYNGVKRSNNIRSDNVPAIILSNEFKPSDKTAVTFSASYQMGSRYAERLDWYDARNPNPNYYQNAPSFLTNPVDSLALVGKLQANPSLMQMDWNSLYLTNFFSTDSVPTKNRSGKWSRYIMYRDMQDVSILTANGLVRHQLNDKIGLYGGLMAQINNTHFYRKITDLLGGDFFVNVNLFSADANPGDPNAIHNDVNNPYQIVGVGDKYGSNYKAKATNITTWGQAILTLNKIDAFVAVRAEQTGYQREGLYKNGAYANNSFGNSESASFTNISAKGGVTYKLNGKNYFSLNALRMSTTPTFEQVFALPSVSNKRANGVESMITNSAEFTYNHRGARTKGYISGFFTQTSKETDFNYMFSEINESFGKIVIRDISRQYIGIEVAAEQKIGTTGFTALALASIGHYTNTNRPLYSFYNQNTDFVAPEKTVYWKDMYVSNGPQIAGLTKLSYFSKQFWSASISLNYWGKNFADMSVERRTAEAVSGVSDPNLYARILKQEALPSNMTVDVFFRKSFMLNKYIKTLKRRMYFDVNVQMSNILNNTNVITTGFEQQRYDVASQNPNRFPTRYFFMMGRTYSVSAVFRM